MSEGEEKMTTTTTAFCCDSQSLPHTHTVTLLPPSSSSSSLFVLPVAPALVENTEQSNPDDGRKTDHTARHRLG